MTDLTELWVATDLTILETTHHTATDSYLPWADATGVRTYWRLTATVWAWLVRKMRGARTAAEAGHLDAGAWQVLQKRFAAVKAVADAHPEVSKRLTIEAVRQSLAVSDDLPSREAAERDQQAVAFLQSVSCKDVPCVGLLVERGGGKLELVAVVEQV